MIWLVLTAAASTATAEPRPVQVEQRQAQALVRIVRAASIRLGDEQDALDHGASLRTSRLRDREGNVRSVRLTEFP